MIKKLKLASQSFDGNDIIGGGLKLTLEQTLKNYYASWRSKNPELAKSIELEQQKAMVQYWQDIITPIKEKLDALGENGGKEMIALNRELVEAESECRYWQDGSAWILELGCYNVWERGDFSKSDRKLAYLETFLTPSKGTKLTVKEAYNLASEEEINDAVNFFLNVLKGMKEKLEKLDQDEKNLSELVTPKETIPQLGSE